MDSLLANYASSDEGEEAHELNPSEPTSKTSGFTRENPRNPSDFPQSESSSLLFSLPPPKSSLSKPQNSSNFSHLDLKDQVEEGEDSASMPTSSRFGGQSPLNSSSAAKTPALFSSIPEPKSSSVFSSLPPPKLKSQTLPNPSSSNPRPKRVVQFKPPINPSLVQAPVVDDDDEDEVRKPAREGEFSAQAPSVKSFLSSIPAPKNSSALGALPSFGSGRRSVVEADVPALESNGSKLGKEEGMNSNLGGNHESHWIDGSSSVSEAPSEVAMDGGNFPSSHSVSENCENHDNYGSYVNYVDYGHGGSDWSGSASMMMTPDSSGMVESAVRMPRKRGRNEAPIEIVEVKQDELIKNRPREDQVKSTGIAFGPSYQPVSTKGKPTKLHKRKHQIGSLYFDMKQKETELAERRSKGFLTKAETQAKYGW